jgi:predicted regulator of Ras-like GTPase activity (Roadblock/LC7/MglB family)
VFDTILARIVQLSGGRGAALISVDGLSIDAVDESGRSVAPDEATREYASVLKQLSSAGEAMEVGDVGEVTLEGLEETTVVRMVTPAYFVALRLPRDVPVGRGRFQLRVAAPDLVREL